MPHYANKYKVALFYNGKLQRLVDANTLGSLNSLTFFYGDATATRKIITACLIPKKVKYKDIAGNNQLKPESVLAKTVINVQKFVYNDISPKDMPMELMFNHNCFSEDYMMCLWNNMSFLDVDKRGDYTVNQKIRDLLCNALDSEIYFIKILPGYYKGSASYIETVNSMLKIMKDGAGNNDSFHQINNDDFRKLVNMLNTFIFAAIVHFYESPNNEEIIEKLQFILEDIWDMGLEDRGNIAELHGKLVSVINLDSKQYEERKKKQPRYQPYFQSGFEKCGKNLDGSCNLVYK
jgi:hypothetical protein